MDTSALAKRMKKYEVVPKNTLMRRTPVIIRVDGRAFHTFTKGFQKPFDDVLMRVMQDTMKYLCENIQGCVFGYTQSDEITLILIDYKKLNSEAWFDYEVQKMCSIVASMTNHIGEICRDRGILFHTDCVQAAGCHPIDANIIGCDFATISGHKIYAPKGIGAIYIKDKTLARSLIYGGANQEFGLRGGTENVASIVGLGKACDLICSDFGTQRVTVSLLKRLFYENMISYLKELNLEDRIHVNGASVGDVGKTLNLRVEDIDSETLLLMLDAKGVCISAGSACHSHRSEPSRVLTAMGLSDDEARDSVRISFSSTNTPAEIEEAAAIFSSCIKTLAGLQR